MDEIGRTAVREGSPATAEPPPAPLSFGPFVADPETGRLYEGDRVIPLAPKPFETLYYLASRPGRVVPKSELMEKLWPDTFVTDDVLVQCVVDIRRALGDPARSPRFVQTIPRRGYQFVASVRVVSPTAPADTAAPGESTPVGGPEPAEALPHPLPAAKRPSSGRERRAVLAASVLGVVLLASAAYFVRGRLASRPDTGAGFEPGSLLVVPLVVDEPAPQSRWLRQGLAEMIGAQLGQTPGVRVVARHRVAGALAEAGFSEDLAPSAEAARRLGRQLGAEGLLSGSFVRFEDRFVLTATITQVDNGRTQAAATVRGRHPGEILDGVDELCLKLLRDLRPGEGPESQPSWRPTRLATRSLEASRHYVEALRLFDRGGRKGAEEAEARLDQALSLDAGFAQAHVKKAEIQHWRRRWGFGDPDPSPAVRAASGLARDLPDRERLLVESFEELILRENPSGALRHWNSLLQFYPTYAQEAGVPALAADTFLSLGRWDELIMIGEAHVDSPSLPDGERARLSHYLSQAFRRKGEMERALQHARRAATLWPARQGPRFLSERVNLGRVSLEASARAEALVEFRAVAAAAEADVTNLTDAAWGLYMAGEAQEAEALVGRAVALDPAYGNAHHLRGWLRLAERDYRAAADSLLRAFERTPSQFGNPHLGTANGDLAALYYSGVARLGLGDREGARAVFERLLALCRRLEQASAEKGGEAGPWQAASYHARAAARLGQPAPEPPRLQGDDTTFFVQSARLHAVQGRQEQALRELAQGLALGHGEHRHVHDDPDFDSLRETPEFKRLVTERLPR